MKPPAWSRGWVTLALCAAAVVAAARPPDFPPPQNARVSKVADDMTVLGRTMSVRAFTSDDAVEDIVAFYQDLWKEPPAKGAPGVAYEPDAIAPWKLLTRVEAGYVMTVQVQEREPRGSFGFLAMGLLPEPGEPAATAPQPPAMDGSEVRSNVISRDAGKNAQTAMLSNEHSLDSNVHFYRNYYQGWRKDMDTQVSRGKLHALSFTRGRRQVVITIEGGRDGSQVVVNSVEHDLL